MKRLVNIDITYLLKKYGNSIVKGEFTEHLLIQNFKYPNFSNSIDKYIEYFNNKDINIDYDNLVTFIVSLDFIISREMYIIDKELIGISFKDVKKLNNIVYVTMEGRYS